MNSCTSKILFVTILIISFNIRCNAQILVTDAQSKEFIPFVEVFTDSGIYLGSSDEKGIIDLSVLGKYQDIKDSTKLVFTQMAYESVIHKYKDIIDHKYLSLIQKSIMLNELVVKPKKQNSTIVLTAYYRSYQLKGNQLEYFSDGLIELAYSPENTKGLNKRLSERSWFNPNLKPESNFIINMVGPPVPDMKEIIESKKEKGSRVYKLLKSDIKQGLTILEIAKNDSENVKTIKALGNKSIINFNKEKFVFDNFSSTETDIDYLEYYSINKKLKFQCKECDYFQDYNMFSELFITDIQYNETFSKKGFSKFTGSPNASHFESDFWTMGEKHRFFQPLNEKIKTELQKLILKPVKQSTK